MKGLKESAPVQALEDAEQEQDLEDSAPVQALEGGEQVQDLEDCDHLNQGELILAAVVVPGSALEFLGTLEDVNLDLGVTGGSWLCRQWRLRGSG